METLAAALAVLVAVAFIYFVAGRIGVPYPALFVLGGLAMLVLPGPGIVVVAIGGSDALDTLRKLQKQGKLRGIGISTPEHDQNSLIDLKKAASDEVKVAMLWMFTEPLRFEEEGTYADVDAPIKLVTAPHTPGPFSPPLEQAVLPQADDMKEALSELLGY